MSSWQFKSMSLCIGTISYSHCSIVQVQCDLFIKIYISSWMLFYFIKVYWQMIDILTKDNFLPVLFYVILRTYKIVYKKWCNNALGRNGTWQELVTHQYRIPINKGLYINASFTKKFMRIIFKNWQNTHICNRDCSKGNYNYQSIMLYISCLPLFASFHK